MNEIQKMAAGIARSHGMLNTSFSNKNREFELAKNKSKYKNAWKKEAKLYV